MVSAEPDQELADAVTGLRDHVPDGARGRLLVLDLRWVTDPVAAQWWLDVCTAGPNTTAGAAAAVNAPAGVTAPAGVSLHHRTGEGTARTAVRDAYRRRDQPT